MLPTSFSQPNTLVYGFIKFPPYIYLNEQGQGSGYVVEQVIKPLQQHYNFVYKQYPAKRFYAELKKGNIDFNIASLNPDVVPFVHVAQQPVLSIKLGLYSKMPLHDVDDLGDIHGSRLGGMRGFNFVGAIDYINNPAHGFSLQRVNNRSRLYKLLDIGRIDYVLDYMGPAAKHVASTKRLYQRELMRFPCHIVVPKSRPQGQQLLHRLTTILAQQN